MHPFDPILIRQLPMIQKIIADETWLEGERRGCRVGSDDRVVRDRVCQVILQVGQQLRESITGSTWHSSSPSKAPAEGIPPEPGHPA